uniref:Uncharacterized protein n=1 Tax=Lepeophtheirus salmonis TaxID=72036 RepID=A0A0K2T132_LEPSM
MKRHDYYSFSPSKHSSLSQGYNIDFWFLFLTCPLHSGFASLFIEIKNTVYQIYDI